VEHEACHLQHPLTNRLMREILPVLEELSIKPANGKGSRGILQQLLIRVGVCTDQLMLVLITGSGLLPRRDELVKKLTKQVPELASIYQEIRRGRPGRQKVELHKLWGEDRIIDYIGKYQFKISPRSFFQVNTLQTKVLYDQVASYAGLAGKEIVLDAYCGIGTISLYLSGQAELVYGVESLAEAVADAEGNAALNQVDNVFFYQGRVEKVIPVLAEKLRNPDIIVVDPPRAGCDSAFLDFCLGVKPDRFIYVSCNPATLARDLQYLQAGDLQPVAVQPVDMFPHTYHIESVVLLARK
ncbi:MAG: 23S rRNA (uracil(1939)-C(5))-methyltransferase RlmD, partial [Halanaerobium sp.]|nr:23S rRNA (uracil(1939)-C(5))-methyltransferase RlmD [Halanaerobium sp.]